ncbi:MAG: acetate kinase [Candidatus Woesearchaeota archaeon]
MFSKILSINSGSTSIKYALFSRGKKVCWGIADRIGLPGSFIILNCDGEKTFRCKLKNHSEALNEIFRILTANSVIRSLSEIGAVGHRVVHGGKFKESVVITKHVISTIRRYSRLAPLHNPANLLGIRACAKLMPKAIQVAVFDTAFHTSIPKRSRAYPIPLKYYKEGIVRYGFHGISHNYACLKAAEILGKKLKNLRVISCHLGGGSSVAAVLSGRCIDTSMGFTPMEGLMMGTRCGDVDPGIIIHLLKNGMSVEELETMLNRKSGVIGIMGDSSDFRDVLKGLKSGSPKARLAFEMFAYRISKYIGAYAAALGGVDVIIFTGGIGQNSGVLRSAVLKNLEFLGVHIDKEKNMKNEELISEKDSPVKVVVVKADEERMIALETERVLRKQKRNA